MADEKSYIEGTEIVKNVGSGDLIPLLRGQVEGSSVYNAEKVYARADNLIPTTNTTFTPTVSNEVQGTLGISNFMIDKVGDIVTFSFFGQFVLDGGQTEGSANIDLPSAFAPDNNWSSATEIVGVISRTNDIFTGECIVVADTGGNKLVNLEFNDTSAGATIRFTAICRYKVNN